jgi:hypothetical protein
VTRKRLTPTEHAEAHGLDFHERLTLVEKAVPKQWRQIEALRRRVADLEAEVNRWNVPWYLRLFVARKAAALPATAPADPAEGAVEA